MATGTDTREASRPAGFLLVATINPAYCPACEGWSRSVWHHIDARGAQRVVCCESCADREEAA